MTTGQISHRLAVTPQMEKPIPMSRKTRAVRVLIAFGAVAVLGTAACGNAEDGTSDATANAPTAAPNADAPPDAGSTEVAIEMIDIAYRTDDLVFSAGETVKFDFTNRGVVAHEAVIGDLHAQEDHEDTMSGGGGHDDSGEAHEGVAAVTVQPGETTELDYTFAESGEIFVGCHVPGHWAAGMKAAITVN